jgi:hypothetical protein
MRYPVVAQAIRERRVLRITYNLKNRLVEPHAYGIDSDNDDLLRAWQTAPLPDGWKSLPLRKATAIVLTDTHFAGPRAGYRKGDRAMKLIYEEL